MQGAGLDYLKGQTNVFSEHRQEEASYYFTSEGSHDSSQNVSTGFEDLVEDTRETWKREPSFAIRHATCALFLVIPTSPVTCKKVTSSLWDSAFFLVTDDH